MAQNLPSRLSPAHRHGTLQKSPGSLEEQAVHNFISARLVCTKGKTSLSHVYLYCSDENDLFFEVDGPKHMKPIFCDPWDDDGYEYDAAVPVLNCRLRDVQQKSLVLSDPCELKALHLNGPNLRQQVVFSMSFVLGEGNDSKTPVALGIKGKNLYLTCVMKGDKPTLQLESVDPKSYPKKRMEPRFVFNKIEVKDKVEFESAQFPNWYISTSQAEHLPVFLGNNSGQDITDFTMEFVS
ncbi:interleukin 1 beta [Ictidomys tridecemlineatus]|nr:interleukin 1 beta [Ictidomys tridecemlineatus]